MTGRLWDGSLGHDYFANEKGGGLNRRGFLASMLACGAAPAIVRAESIMRIKPIVLPGEAEFEAVVARNTLIPIDQIRREALAILERNLMFTFSVMQEQSNEWLGRS